MLYPWQIVTRSMGIRLAGRLPLAVDPERLRHDLNAVQASIEATAHDSRHLHNGGLKTIGLVTSGGAIDENRPDIGKAYRKTEALSHCPYIETFLDGLGMQTGRVRFLSLPPGSQIFWHCDPMNAMDGYTPGYTPGNTLGHYPSGHTARVHVPIVTDPKAYMQICHETYCWQPGEVWWSDFSFPHRVANRSDKTRVHLVMDLLVDDAFLKLLPEWFWQQRTKRIRARRYATQLCRLWHLYRPDYRPRVVRQLRRRLRGPDLSAGKPGAI